MASADAANAQKDLPLSNNVAGHDVTRQVLNQPDHSGIALIGVP
jgi:hypothetical protein